MRVHFLYFKEDPSQDNKARGAAVLASLLQKLEKRVARCPMAVRGVILQQSCGHPAAILRQDKHRTRRWDVHQRTHIIYLDGTIFRGSSLVSLEREIRAG